jgi:hypothetical protein
MDEDYAPDIYAFLETLRVPESPEETLIVFDSLYGCPWVTLAVFQSLEPLPKQLFMRLLLFPDPVDTRLVLSWVSPDAIDAAHRAIVKLVSLHIISRTCSPAFVADLSTELLDDSLIVRDMFRQQMMKHLSSDSVDMKPWAPQVVENPLRPDTIERCAAGEWQSILNFLVRSLLGLFSIEFGYCDLSVREKDWRSAR